jgi:transcriptional regulator GlxA family with amidase domain
MFGAARTSRGLGPRTFRLLGEYVEAHLTGPIRLAELAEIAGMSNGHQ